METHSHLHGGMMNSLMMTQFRGPPAYGNLVTHPHMPFAPQTTNMAPLQHPPSLLNDFGMQFGPMSRPDPPASNEIPKTATLKHVKLAAFNIFGASVREDFQKRRGNTSGRDVEKWIGQRWREMPESERQQYHDLAREELEMRGGVPAPKKKRKAGGDNAAVAKKKKAKTKTKEGNAGEAFLGCAVNGFVDDTFEGGLCACVNIECPDGATKEMRLMIFHPSLVNIS